MTLLSLFHNISKRKTRVKKEIVSVSYSKNHSNFNYCCSFYVRKKGVNFLFDAICKCGYIAFENVLIDETDMRLLCDTAEDALEILKRNACKKILKRQFYIILLWESPKKRR